LFLTQLRALTIQAKIRARRRRIDFHSNWSSRSTDEGFTVMLSNPSTGATLGTASAIGTIRNYDPVLSITTASADEAEGLTGSQLDSILVGSGTINLGAGSDTINLKSTSADLNNLGATDASIQSVDVISAAAAGSGVTITLSGQSENFTIAGGSGADTIVGGDGADKIIGNGGGDTLTGHGGANTYTYNTTSDSLPGTYDTITDFLHGQDQIDLSALAGLTAVVTETSVPAAIAAHTIDIVTTGGNTVIYANTTNDWQTIGATDMEIHLAGVTNVTSSDLFF
jgi:Ca2+-binding RTX toxin-like protein